VSAGEAGDGGTAGGGGVVTRRSRLSAAALPLAAVLAFAGQFLISLRTGTHWTTIVPGAVLYLAAFGLLVLGRFGGTDAATAARGDTAAPADPSAPRFLSGRVEWTLVVIIVLGGLFLRLWAIDVIPTGLNNDEAINAIEANEIAAGKPFATLTERGLNRETMFHYLAAFSFKNPGLMLNVLRAVPVAFGLTPRFINDPMSDAILPLRAVSIVAGTLTILLLYLFARGAFGVRVGLFAALFLAVSPWHLLYSRTGERVILAPIFAIATAALFLRAWRTTRLVDHLLWGVAAGLGFWTYTSFRAVPLALLAFVVLYAWRVARARATPAADEAQRRVGLVAGAGVAGVLLIGLMLLSGMPPLGFLMRGAYAAMPPQTHWLQNLVHAVTMQNYFPLRYAVIQSDEFISDGISASFGAIGLEPDTLLLAAFATLGLACLAWRGFRRGRVDDGAARRDPAAALLVLMVLSLWLTIGWLGPSLTRMLLNLPWLCIAAAIVAVGVWDGLADLLRPFGSRLPGFAARVVAVVPGLLMAGIAALACAQGYSNYFLLAGRSERAMQHYGPTQTIMGMYTRSLPQDQDVIVLHTLRVDTLHYLVGNRPNVQFVTDTTKVSLEKLISSPRTVTFVVEYARPFAEPLRSLMMRFPQGDMGQVADARFDPDKIIFFTFTIWKNEAGQIISVPGAPPLPPGAAPGGPGDPGAPPPPGSVPPS
jgi:Dolichyl-phosphate-mannose-protein mannosyltransferase